MLIVDKVLARTVIHRVRRGAQALDAQRPKWHREINLEILDMGDPSACVLGQIFSTYRQGLRMMCFTEFSAIYRGFNGWGPQFMASIVFRALTLAWSSEILRRQAFDLEVDLSYQQMRRYMAVGRR